jgi:ADP-heptose:LPS heptosyltransferase
MRSDRPRRILAVRLGAIGDCLRVLPAVVRLRAAFPEAEIGWAVGDLVEPLLAGHPDITRLHVLRRREMRSSPLAAWFELRRLGAELSEGRYDVAIDFHTRLKSGLLTFASRAPRRIGFDRASGTEANYLFTNEHVRLYDRYENRVLRFQRLLVPLGLPWSAEIDGLRPWIGPAVLESARRMHADAGRPEVALFPATSAARPRDRWPADRWREAVRLLEAEGVRSMLLWGPGELAFARAIADGSRGCLVAPPTSLPEMMAILGLFGVYAGANTAALHMAWMQGVPSVVLVGGRPWRTDRPLPPVPSIMLSAGGIEAARKLRGQAASRAIAGIEPAELVTAVRSMLDAPRPFLR